MALTHAVSTNIFGNNKFIVATSAANGTHTTLAGALADAVSGDTIVLRDSVSENVTAVPGVLICGQPGGGAISVSGTITITTAGIYQFSNLLMTNAAANALVCSGSAVIAVTFNDCRILVNGFTGISLSNTNGVMTFMGGGATTLSINALFAVSAGILQFLSFYHDAAAIGTSTVSGGIVRIRNSQLACATTTSSSGQIEYGQTHFPLGSLTITHGATSGTSFVDQCRFGAGGLQAVSVSAGATLSFTNNTVDTTNTPAISGAGTIIVAGNTFSGTAFSNTTTTQTARYFNPGIMFSAQQPAFGATGASQANVSGDGTDYTVLFATEIFDQNNNYASPTFTAPITAKYRIGFNVEIDDLGVANTFGATTLVTSNRNYGVSTGNYGAMRGSGNILQVNCEVLADMDAADTSSVVIVVSGGTKIVDVCTNGNCNFFAALEE